MYIKNIYLRNIYIYGQNIWSENESIYKLKKIFWLLSSCYKVLVLQFCALIHAHDK